jgi:hypothetical protein
MDPQIAKQSPRFFYQKSSNMRYALAFILTALPGHAESVADNGWPSEEHRAYWMQGKGEITSYKLTQARYGEVHQGEAVLIFVSEPFSRSKQVKLDDWEHAGSDAVEVLKLNFTKKFLTGIYPYSLMLSTFSPIGQQQRTLKVSMSGQEWCGHVFGQMNWRDDHYAFTQFSYFESEGDRESKLPAEILEDELWARIRLAPEKLPTGNFKIIPGMFISRLLHVSLKAEEVKGNYIDQMPEKYDPAAIRGYRLDYQTGYDRSLTVYFERSFPHAIVGWEETYTDLALGKTKQKLTTHAERISTILIDYWTKHGNADRELRSKLGLPVEH